MFLKGQPQLLSCYTTLLSQTSFSNMPGHICYLCFHHLVNCNHPRPEDLMNLILCVCHRIRLYQRTAALKTVSDQFIRGVGVGRRYFWATHFVCCLSSSESPFNTKTMRQILFEGFAAPSLRLYVSGVSETGRHWTSQQRWL